MRFINWRSKSRNLVETTEKLTDQYLLRPRQAAFLKTFSVKPRQAQEQATCCPDRVHLMYYQVRSQCWNIQVSGGDLRVEPNLRDLRTPSLRLLNWTRFEHWSRILCEIWTLQWVETPIDKVQIAEERSTNSCIVVAGLVKDYTFSLEN